MYHIKNDKRAKHSSERIFESLKLCMKEKNFQDITVKEVVERAEVARATFYRNFDRLEDVLRYELDTKFSELYDYLKEYYKSEPDYFKSFFIVPFLKFWYADSAIVELLIMARQRKVLSEAFVSLLERGISEYYGDGEIEIDHFNYFLAFRSGIAINVLVEWIRTGKKETPEEVIKILSEQVSSSMHMGLFSN
ncbi:MAG: TetR/AcrR family transcriptional regulator [Tissierellales bacterium]|nr:TetR/AcrR family transcriptional regulator [Tissierellales bacterium]